jgi:hypothetical protein
MSPEAAQDLPEGRNNYLITISDEIVLNCEQTANARPIPLCYASNSNMAEGLHRQGVTLTINNNNASAWLRLDEHGRPVADLYAVVPITTGDEIMWSYGPEYEEGFDQSAFSDDVDRDTTVGSEGGRNMAASLSPEARAPPSHRRGLDLLQNVIVRLDHGLDQRDPMPEWAFANDDISYESSVSGDVPEPERKED